MGRTCSNEDMQMSATACAEQQPGRRFACVPVHFDSVSDGKVTIRAKAAGSPVVASESPLLVPNPIDWNDPRLWTRCPSDFEEAGGLPVAKTHGTLYMREDLLKQNQLAYRAKWPAEGDGEAREYADLRLRPTRVTLHGREMHSGREKRVELELFNELDVDLRSEVTIKRDGTVVRVSDEVFHRLHLGSPNERLLTRARATIAGPESAPYDLAEAWTLVSRAADWLARGADSERAGEHYRRVRDIVAAILAQQKATTPQER